MSKGIDTEWSHDRVRAVVRVENVTPLPSDVAAPMHDPTTGRFLPGNRAYRRRQLKTRAEGIATLNPGKVPTWMRPHVEGGASYIAALLGMLEGKPALHPLAGDCADAHTMYRATLRLALDAADAKERAALMNEARGWLREHRSCLATLSALAGDMALPEGGPDLAALERQAEAETERRRQAERAALTMSTTGQEPPDPIEPPP